MALKLTTAALPVKTSSSSKKRRLPLFETLEGRQLMSAAISGTVFNDLNASGALKAGDPGISHVQVYIDTTNVGSYKAGDPMTFTDNSGNYTLSGLTAGAKIVREIVPSGFRQTFPTNGNGQHLTLPSSTSHAMGVNFGDTQKVRLTGSVFNDVNKDGGPETFEPLLGNVTVYLDLNHNGVFDSSEPTAKTNSSGSFVFDDLTPGTSYMPRIVLSGSQAGAFAGWVQSSPTYGGSYTFTGQNGNVLTGDTFGIHAPSNVVYNSQVRTILAIAGSTNHSYTVGTTGFSGSTETATSGAQTAVSQMTSDISSSGVFATGTMSASGFTSGDSAFSAIDATFTLSASTGYFLNYSITGNGFYFAVKDLTTGQTVIGPNQANPTSPQFSYGLGQGGTLAAGKYQLLFNNNNAAGQPLQTLAFNMNFSL